MPDPIQSDNPTNAGATNADGTKTDVLNDLVDIQPSGGEPGSTTPPTSTADVTGQPDDDKTKPDDSGKVTRLEQRLSQQNQLLTSIGIDPESDIAERFQRGLVNKEELLMQTGAPAAPATPQPATTTQTLSPMERSRQLKQRVAKSVQDGKGILETDILEMMTINEDLADENIQVRQEANMEKNFIDCRDAALAVIGKDELHSKAPENIKAIEEQVFLSSTDNFIAVESKGDSRYVTPNNYTFYGEKNLKDSWNILRNHWIEYGKSLGAPPPAPNPDDVNPISPTVGGAPITPPETPTTLENVEARARAYVEQRGLV